MGRRDDLWSFYFVILEFLNEMLPWKGSKDYKADDVKEMKNRCLNDPEQYLWKTNTANMQQIKNIFWSIKRLKYADRPDYKYIREQLSELLKDEECAKTCGTV